MQVPVAKIKRANRLNGLTSLDNLWQTADGFLRWPISRNRQPWRADALRLGPGGWNAQGERCLMFDVSPVAGMNFLTSVYAQTWAQAWTYLNGTSTYEMLRLLDQIDRADLKEFLNYADNMAGKVGMERIIFAATVVQSRALPAGSGANLSTDVADARKFLTGRSPLRITSDATHTLPPPVPNQPALSQDDFEAAAAELDVEPAAVRAVATVESGGSSGFAADGRAIIRYELHVFNKRSHGKYGLTHPQFAAGYRTGIRAHTRANAQANEYSMLYGAMLMRGQRENAMASASWGAFQLMGFNHQACGFATASDLAKTLSLSASNQLTAFLEFCKTKRAARYLQTKDWAGFALHYNGPDYQRNHYDTNLAAAYRKAGGHV
jgi:hypothetical protein